MVIHDTLLLIITLLLVIFFLMMIGEKLRIAYPIFLVLGGLAIGFVPSIPDVSIDPNIVFLIFLPPLLYEAAWSTSWHEFWKYRLVISSLGFGLVIVTSGVVAYFSSSLITGFTLPLGFLLGSIISPPDAVAATSILKSVNVPKRLLVILEGESLVNDASSLIVYRFALAAATTSSVFMLKDAAVGFFFVTFGGIIIGVVVAFLIYIIHRVLPTNTNMDVALTIVSPYLMYIIAEHYEVSGVMSVVSGALFLSFRYRDFLNYESHMQAVGTWKTIGFVLNGFVFILIGLELPITIKAVDEETLDNGIKYGLVISAITILIRVIWVYGLVYLFNFLRGLRNRKLTERNWRNLFVMAWAAMRGVVSLAAALSIPLSIGGVSFPYRNLLLLITFVVILVTLVFQGLMLPLVIKISGISEKQAISLREQEQRKMELRLMSLAVYILEKEYGNALQQNRLLQYYKESLTGNILVASKSEEVMEMNTLGEEKKQYTDIMKVLIALQRNELRLFRRANMFGEELIRKKELELDLSEAQLKENG